MYVNTTNAENIFCSGTCIYNVHVTQCIHVYTCTWKSAVHCWAYRAQPRHKLDPLVSDGPVDKDGVGVRPRRADLAGKLHTRLLGRAPRLAMVACYAGADNVLPRVRAAPVPRHHVVQGELTSLAAAVKARVLVAQKDLPPRQAPLEQGAPYEVHKPDHGRDWECCYGGVHLSAAVLEQLRLAHVKQNNGAAHRAHVEWLVVLVQNQDGRADRR